MEVTRVSIQQDKGSGAPTLYFLVIQIFNAVRLKKKRYRFGTALIYGKTIKKASIFRNYDEKPEKMGGVRILWSIVKASEVSFNVLKKFGLSGMKKIPNGGSACLILSAF